MPLQVLRMTTSKIIGGSVTHRLDDHVTKRGTLNSFRPNITTHFYYSTDMMGKFSRGRENYNLHFQGAVHYGFSWLQISICHAQQFKRPRVLHLVYKGECCEERLLDTLLQNDHAFPLVKVHSDNPLLYSFIEVLPVAFSPTTKSFFKHITKGPAAEAIAFILFTRCITSSATYTIGLTEQANPTMSHVGVAEIVGAGQENIIHHLSKYLHLYMPKDQTLAREIMHNLSSRCFIDTASVCLIPEVLPHLEKIAGFGQIPEMFWNKDAICNLLKRMVETKIEALNRNPVLELKTVHNTVYYPTVNLGIDKIMTMWTKQVWIMTLHEADLFSIIRKIGISQNIIGNYPDATMSLNQVTQLLDNGLGSLIPIIFENCLLLLAAVPADQVARDARFRLQTEA
jgi:hypothetical protein